MNRTSSSSERRRKRAYTSAGSMDPTRLPRCLTPLTYGSALVIRWRGIADSEASDGDSLGGLLLHESEHVTRDAPHLDFLTALSDPVSPVMTIDVFEGHVPGISESAVHLHGAVGRVATQPVRDVVAHRDLVGDRERTVLVHRPRRLVNQRAEHFALRLQLDERELDRLVRRERFAERRTLLGVRNGLVDAELRGAEARRGLAYAVLVEEVLRHLEPGAFTAEDRRVRHPHVG